MAAASSFDIRSSDAASSLEPRPPESLAMFPKAIRESLGPIAQRLHELLPWVATLPPVTNTGSLTGYYDAFRLSLEATLEPGVLIYKESADLITGAFQEACKHNHVLYLQDLLATGRVALSEIADPLRSAARNGHLETVSFWLGTRMFASSEIGTACCIAARNGHLDVVKTLLAARQSRPDQIARALFLAAQHGHLDVVDALLATGEISNGTLEKTAIQATLKGHFQVAQIITRFRFRFAINTLRRLFFEL